MDEFTDQLKATLAKDTNKGYLFKICFQINEALDAAESRFASLCDRLKPLLDENYTPKLKQEPALEPEVNAPFIRDLLQLKIRVDNLNLKIATLIDLLPL